MRASYGQLNDILVSVLALGNEELARFVTSVLDGLEEADTLGADELVKRVIERGMQPDMSAVQKKSLRDQVKAWFESEGIKALNAGGGRVVELERKTD